MINVPLLDTRLQNEPLRDELDAAVARVLDSGGYLLGPEVEALETEVAALCGCRHGVAMASGTDALLVALTALGIGPGDEVLVPAFTFFATAGSVARLGAVPVFTDVCPVCFNLDIADAERKITPRTRAIMPVHLFGQAAELDGIMELAGSHGLEVVEDAAQAIGARYRDRPCGSIGRAGCLSFYPTKNLGGFGDGGMVVTNDDDLAARMRQLRNHGMEPRYVHHQVGGNFRLDALQGAMLRVKLPRLGDYTAARQRHARQLIEGLAGLPGIDLARPDDCGCPRRQAMRETAAGTRLVLPVAYPHNDHVWNQFTVRVTGGPGRRDALRSHLADHGIASEIYYPLTLDQQPCFAGLPAHARAGLETSHRLATEVLSLPVFPELTAHQMEHMLTTVAGFVQG